MRKIFKYQLDLLPVQVVRIPARPYVYSCQYQNDVITLWLGIDETEEIIDTTFYIIPTGGEVPNREDGFIIDHLATLQDKEGFVWHIFYRRKIDTTLGDELMSAFNKIGKEDNKKLYQ